MSYSLTQHLLGERIPLLIRGTHAAARFPTPQRSNGLWTLNDIDARDLDEMGASRNMAKVVHIEDCHREDWRTGTRRRHFGDPVGILFGSRSFDEPCQSPR